MLSSRRTVHIPIVRLGDAPQGYEDRLIEVYTQLHGFDALTRDEVNRVQATDIKARDKDWDQVAAPLRKVGLYQAGCAAASAVRKLGIEPPFSALYQRISRLAWIEGQRLQSATPQGPSEGRSAELGLGLVLLMCASGSRDRQVIATGALGAQPQGVSDDDVEILPVGSLVEKLRLVLALAGHNSLPRFEAGRELLFFTPRQFDDVGEMRDVASLSEVDQLQHVGVRVVPVNHLSEAAAVLNAKHSRHLFPDRVAQAAIFASILIASVTAIWSALPAQTVPLTFQPAGGLAQESEPYEACFTNDGGFHAIPFGRAGVARNMPSASTLGWRVQVGEPIESDGWLNSWFADGQYYVAQVMLSEHSRSKVIVPQSTGDRDLTIPSGDFWEWGWQLIDVVESNVIVLLANPDQPFKAEDLNSAFLERFPEAADPGKDLDITAAANFLVTQAPGSVRFAFQTVETPSRCSS